jgi:hypothetical protein
VDALSRSECCVLQSNHAPERMLQDHARRSRPKEAVDFKRRHTPTCNRETSNWSAKSPLSGLPQIHSPFLVPSLSGWGIAPQKQKDRSGRLHNSEDACLTLCWATPIISAVRQPSRSRQFSVTEDGRWDQGGSSAVRAYFGSCRYGNRVGGCRATDPDDA